MIISSKGPYLFRVAESIRGIFSKRALLKLSGVESVVLGGRAYIIKPVPLRIAREMIPAMIRCSRKMADWNFDESLYDDFIKTLSLGLGAKQSDIEALTVALWELSPVIEMIARANSLPEVEGPNMGKARKKPIGTTFMRG